MNTQVDWDRVSKEIDVVLHRRRHAGFGKIEGDTSDVLGREVQLAIWRKEFDFAERLLAQCIQFEDRYGLDSPEEVTYRVAASQVPSLWSLRLAAVEQGDREAERKFDAVADVGFEELVQRQRQIWVKLGQREGHVSAATKASPAWTEADSRKATAEGWDVFDSDVRGPEIERIDSPEDAVGRAIAPEFESDREAIAHVYVKAQEGSYLHQKALYATLLEMKDFKINFGVGTDRAPAAAGPKLSADAGLARWIINNLLTESQLDVVPPGYEKVLRHLAEPREMLAPSEVLAETLREVFDSLEHADVLGAEHPSGGTVGGSIIKALSSHVETRLQALGYKMDIDPGGIPGEGHLLFTLGGQDVDPDTAPEEVRELAREWSELVDRLMELEPEGFDIEGPRP